MLKHFEFRMFLSLLAFILIISGIIRLWGLGAVPDGFTWDEAAIGYNGYALITTRRDEWLEKLPLSVRSFGDYKAPLAIYINGVFTVLFGLSVWVVRLPFALSGILTVGLFTLIVWQLWHDSKWRVLMSLMGGVLITLSPWHIVFSRAAFESGMALSLLLVGLLFWFFAFRNKLAGSKYIQLFLIVSAVGMALSMYAYHSAKIAIPVILVGLIWMQRHTILKRWRTFLWFVVAFTTLLAPLAYDHLFGHAAERAGVLILSKGLPLIEVLSQFVRQFALYLSPQFLLFGATDTLRHSTGVYGVMTPVSFLLLIVGIISLIQLMRKKSMSSTALLGIVIIVAGILPAALSDSPDPHPNRALLALPGFLIVALSGFEAVLEYVRRTQVKLVLSALLSAEIIFAAVFLNFYFTEYNKYSGEDYYPGYLQAMQLSEAYLSGEMVGGSVDQVLFSSQYGQPYIYALFTKGISPIWYRGGALNSYLFLDEVTATDLTKNNVLVVSTVEEMEGAREPTHMLTDSSGEVRFRLYRTERVEEADREE